MEDICIVCHVYPATVRTNCSRGCRVLCPRDCKSLLRRENPTCPTCREPISGYEMATREQLKQVKLSDCGESLEQYPNGVLLFQKPVVTDEDIRRGVREAIQMVQAGRLEYDEFQRELGQKLTVVQMELAYLEMVKHEDLHGVLKNYDSRINEIVRIKEFVSTTMIKFSHELNSHAIMKRAAIGTVIDVAATVGLSTAMRSALKVEVISNTFVFLCFAGHELYQYSQGKNPNIRENLGEHLLGMGAAGIAATALGPFSPDIGYLVGTAFGVTVGSAVPVVGPAIGANLGGLLGTTFSNLVVGGLADYIARAMYRTVIGNKEEAVTKVEVENEIKLTAEEIKVKAAEILKIDLENDDFKEAKIKFRKLLLSKHSDKFPNATPEEQSQRTAETQEIIVCWQIVREEYQKSGRIVREEEAFVEITTLKVRDPDTDIWRTERSWVDPDLEVGENPSENEKFERIILYV